MPDTEQRVQEALQTLHHVTDEITITDLHTDEVEKQFLSRFATTGCVCTKFKGKPCSLQFSCEYVESVRASCAELSHSELDMVIFGQLMACVNDSSSVSVVARHQESERLKSYTSFFHRGKPVCRQMFLILHGISKKRLDNLSRSLRVNGLTARVHGNIHRKPKHAVSFSSTEYVVRFLLTYSEEHSLLLPGRIPGYKRSDIQLLPSSTTKRAVWRVYHSAAEAAGSIHAVAYSTFCYLWRTLVPSIVVLKPRSDLCWQCQQNSASIVRTANSSEAEKSTAISDALEHLRIVKLERSYYKSVCD